jgi:hypothetical protein
MNGYPEAQPPCYQWLDSIAGGPRNGSFWAFLGPEMYFFTAECSASGSALLMDHVRLPTAPPAPDQETTPGAAPGLLATVFEEASPGNDTNKRGCAPVAKHARSSVTGEIPSVRFSFPVVQMAEQQ